MTNENIPKKASESSIQFQLAEYSRIQEAESQTRNTGESRFNIYLTLVSVSFAGMWTLWGTTDKQSVNEVTQFYFAVLLIALFMSFMGWHTLKLFMSRWRLTIIYLRKLARIRRWFLDLDESLRDGLTYSLDETKPSFRSKSFFSSSLLTLVVILNCSFTSVVIAMIILLTMPTLIGTVGIIIVCLLVFLVTYLIQYQYYKNYVKRLEQDKSVAFPTTLTEGDS